MQTGHVVHNRKFGMAISSGFSENVLDVKIVILALESIARVPPIPKPEEGNTGETPVLL